jgi:serine/threonine protein kinase
MRPGELIAGRYRVDRSVGEGGMGTVFQARDESGRVVAIKTLLRQGIPMWSADEPAGGDVQLWRFQREVEALARVYHPAIVRSLDHGKTVEGVPFLVLEWLTGHDLSERLAQGPLSVEATVALATQLLGALEVAHRAGVVHRDVKPSNVFLLGGDPARPKLLDFGLARLVNSDLAATVTATGSLVGTPAYLAPEQARGETVDGRADLFSLGCLLFECLSGRRAFRGENPMAVLAKVLLETPPEVVSLRPDVPEWLSQLVTVLLYKDRDRRPPSASAVSAALRSRDVGAALADLGAGKDVGQ